MTSLRWMVTHFGLGEVDRGRVVAGDDLLEFGEGGRVGRFVGRVARGVQQLVDAVVLVEAGVGALAAPGLTGDQRVEVVPGVVIVRPPEPEKEVGPLFDGGIAVVERR